MTKSSPVKTSQRSSSRLSAQAIKKTNGSVTKSTSSTKQASTHKTKKKAIIEFQKGSIVGIRDFKKQSGQTMYLVQRDGPSDDVWETEDMIESLEVLSNFQQKVYQESGYSINQTTIGSGNHEQRDQVVGGEDEGESSRKRPSRVSKARAVIALKRSEVVEEDDDDDHSEDSNGRTRSKSIKTNGGTKQRANKRATSGSGRKTKAQVLLDQQHEERLERQKLREHLNPDEIVCQLDHLSGKNCCLQCGVNTYREALERNDLDGLKDALEGRDLPHYKHEDKPNGLGFIEYAVVLQREQFADVLEEYNKKPSDRPLPSIPSKYKVYAGGDTGRNHNGGEYFRRRFRKVEEARGNRVGNSAFYREDTDTPRKSYMNVEDPIRHSAIRPFIPFISKPAFQDEKVIENYLVHFGNGSAEAYYAIASGNRRLSRAIIQHVSSGGRSTFNHLHEEVLKFDNGQSLTSYRKPQILKMAFDASNVTPYHCAAVNPSATYLSEFYEALDPAERLETDAFGRSVVFYAAVSETTACLEFLLSKSFNITLVDKYKMSPLVQAARFGRSHNVELLIKNLRGGEEVTETPPSIFQTLIRNRRTALHYAAFFGHAETCSVLIKYGAPVECIENLDKQTPLLYAAKNGYVDCVRVLIEEGKANPEKGDKFSRTALHYACMNGHTEVVKYLLSQGVNANVADTSSNCPAHFAAAFGYTKILHLLIEYGSADPSTCNVWRSTPCSIANMKGHIGIVKYLLSLPNSPIDVNFKDQEGCIMLQHCIDESVTTSEEKTANIAKARLLLSMNADVNSVNLEGDSSLHTLASNLTYNKCLPKGWEQFYPFKSVYDKNRNSNPLKEDDIEGIEYQATLAKLLIEYNADLSIKNARQETPLITAMGNENYHLAATLLEAGAKFWEGADKDGNNFFHFYGKFISYVSALQPHYDLDVLHKERLLLAVNRIWNAIESNSALDMVEIEKILHARNNNGRAPFFFSVFEAIKDQKEAMKREKDLILATINTTSSSNNSNNHRYSYGSNDNKAGGYPSKRFEEHTSLVDINLKFNFDIWIEFMSKIVAKFKINVNESADLPKDYKKNNPLAKKFDYPALVGYTALHLAAQTQCVDLLKFLLDSGCNPNIKVKHGDEILSGNTSLMIAYHHKKDKFQEVPDQSLESTEQVKKKFTVVKPDFKEMLKQTVEILLQFNACPFLTNASGNSALMKAASSMDVENIAEMCSVKPLEDIDVNTEDEHGKTALMVAIDSLASFTSDNKKPDVTVVKSLLKANANPNVQYEDGDTVLMKVIRTSYAPLVEILLEDSIVSVDHNRQNKKLETALIVACKLNKPDIVLPYLHYLYKSNAVCDANVYDADKGTALTYAARNGNLQVVNELLSLGASANFNSPQHVPLIEAVSSHNFGIVELLLKYGANVNEQDDKGNAAIHTAILAEKHRIVQLLLQNSANPNLPNARKQSPLHLAVETTKKQTNRSFRVERLLINAGANLNATDYFGRTPLHYVFVESNSIPITRNTAIISKKVKQISSELKIEQDRINALNAYANKFDLVEFEDSSSNEVDYLSTWMKGAKEIQLDQAKKERSEKEYKKKEEDSLVILEEEKEMLKAYDTYGWETKALTPARSDPIDLLKCLSEFDVLHYEAKDDFGRTPLHYAACVGAFSCTTLLIEKKVDINAVDSDNNGALQLALRNNYVDYSVMLCNFGATVKNDIVLKDGQATTTFGFSLSQSLINMAYLIMDRGVTLIESIRDALRNGKFHMVEILLQSAEDEALSEVLHHEGQNIWHVIADFKPFNSEVWEEYVFDITERISSLNLSISKDNSGRTPIHYAAKHGQTALLQRLLAMPNVEINVVDKDDNTELTYAVDSGNIEIVKLLLTAGVKVTSPSGFKKESLVLKSVLADNIRMTELLLYNGAPVDQDSSYGRINAVMVACQKKNMEMLKLLILYKADLSKPTHVERKDKFGRKYTVLLHPIFVASTISSKFLEIMLEAGANPNVHGPVSAPEYGRSCFMYNVALDKVENQKILLNYNIDLNAIDDTKLSRTIFYQFFFGRMGSGNETEHVHPFDALLNSKKLTFNEVIYEKMIQEYKPEVNHVDKVSGMTPLEFAVREKNIVIIEKLLTIGADINVESCRTAKDFVQIMNPSGKKLPAVLHAILQNNIDVVKLLCEKAQHKMNWMWHDDEKHNVISYITGSIGGVSHENVSILEFVVAQIDSKTLKKLLQMRDIYGKSPVHYAHQKLNKELYEAMIRLEPSCTVTESGNMETDDDNNDSPMDIDYITTTKVDEDAQIEREILQKRKDLEKAKKRAAEGRKDDEEEEAVKVDPYSKLEKVGSVMLDENNQPYDIMLLKVEIRGWGVYTETSFYKMSIIHNKVLNLYILWTRWGGYGHEGQHQKTPYLNMEEAIAEFKSIFRSKTANAWEDHSISFVHKLGRYDILKTSHHPTDKIIDNFDFMDSSIPTQLPREITDVMKLICNYTYLSRVYSESHIDMPLGQVPQKTIEQARQILKDVVHMSEKRQEARNNYSDRSKLQEAKTWDFKIAQKCVEYARLLPRNDDKNQPIRSLFDNQNENIKQELARIADLSYVGFAANVILAAKHHIKTINPLEYAYNTLNCSLRNITLETKSAEYQLVKSYMDSTSAGNQELVHLFTVNRAEEEARFRPFEKEANRKLLWHGSRVGNFMGILKQGLRVSPRTSATNGAMLGNGVYFADTFAKSLGYATDYYGNHQSSYKLLLLCEVALGSKTAIYQHNIYNPPNTKELDSMKGKGSNIPDPDNAVHDANGVCVPMGPCIPFARANNSTNTNTFGGYSLFNSAPLLNYNEFAVYDENRVKIRYLMIVRDSKSCFLCSKAKSERASLKPLHEHDVKKYDYAAFNDFEGEVIKAYLTHENKSPQDIFDQGLNEFIGSGKYKQKWNIPLDLRKDSKVCHDCAKDVAAILLEQKMTSCDIDIPESLKSTPQCKYGKECRTQKHNINHTKKYQHWFRKNISEENNKKTEITEEVEDEEEDSAMETDDDEDSMDTDEE